MNQHDTEGATRDGERLISRRTVAQIGLGAAVSLFLPTRGNSAPIRPKAVGKGRKGLIVVIDTTIPAASVYQQFANFRASDPDDPTSFVSCGLYTGGEVGNKFLAKSCAGTCDYWIQEMKQDLGVDQVLVLVWTRRYGPMLTVPLKTRADVLMVRTYARSAHGQHDDMQIANHLVGLQARLEANGRPFVLTIENEANIHPLVLSDLSSFSMGRASSIGVRPHQ